MKSVWKKGCLWHLRLWCSCVCVPVARNMYVLNVGKIMRMNHQSIAHTTSAVIASISSHIHTSTVFVVIPLLEALNKVHTCVIRVGIAWKMQFKTHWVENDEMGSQSRLPIFTLPKGSCICRRWYGWCRTLSPIRWCWVARSYGRDSGGENLRGCPLCLLAAARSAVLLPSHFPSLTAHGSVS